MPETTVKERLYMRKWLKLKPLASLDKLPRDCLAEVLSYLYSPADWLSIMLTCKQLRIDMNHAETAWGMCNIQFTLDPTILMDTKAKIPFERIVSLVMLENPISATRLFVFLQKDLVRLKKLKFSLSEHPDINRWPIDSMKTDTCLEELSIDFSMHPESGTNPRTILRIFEKFPGIHSVNFAIDGIITSEDFGPAILRAPKLEHVGLQFIDLGETKEAAEKLIKTCLNCSRIKTIKINDCGQKLLNNEVIQLIKSEKFIRIEGVDIECLKSESSPVVDKIKYACDSHLASVLDGFTPKFFDVETWGNGNLKKLILYDDHDCDDDDDAAASDDSNDWHWIDRYNYWNKFMYDAVHYNYNLAGNLVLYKYKKWRIRYDGKTGLKTSDNWPNDALKLVNKFEAEDDDIDDDDCEE